jgi:HEAT repeat protein
MDDFEELNGAIGRLPPPVEMEYRAKLKETLGRQDLRASLVEMSKSGPIEQRTLALWCLGRLSFRHDSDDARSLLESLSSEQAAVRLEAARSLGIRWATLSDVEIGRVLAERLGREADLEVRKSLILALAMNRAPGAVEVVAAVAEDVSEETQVRSVALDMLGLCFETPLAQAKLVAATGWPEARLRLAAYAGLGSVGGPEQLPILRGALGSVADEEERQAIHAAITRIVERQSPPQ